MSHNDLAVEKDALKDLVEPHDDELKQLVVGWW
jgi:hypothetical protein